MDPQTASKSVPPFDPSRLIGEHQAGVWRYLRVLGCDAALAEDLTQETFLAVLQRPFTEISPAATASYLRTIAHNLYVSYRRKNRRVLTTDEIEKLEELDREWATLAAADQGEAALEALKICWDRLTDRARQALELRFRSQATREQIAAAVGLTEDGAKNLMQRAKQQLRTCIETKLK